MVKSVVTVKLFLEDKCLSYERNGFISARDMYSFVKLLRYRDTE